MVQKGLRVRCSRDSSSHADSCSPGLALPLTYQLSFLVLTWRVLGTHLHHWILQSPHCWSLHRGTNPLRISGWSPRSRKLLKAKLIQGTWSVLECGRAAGCSWSCMEGDDAHTQRAALPILPTLPCPTTPTLDLPLTLYSIPPLSFILILLLHFPPGFAHFPCLYLSFWELSLFMPRSIFIFFFSISSHEYLGSLVFPFSLSSTPLLPSLTLEIVSWSSIFITHLLIFFWSLGNFPLLLNSQHKVLVPCPSCLCPRPPELAGWTLTPQPLAWFPWSLLHILSVSLTYYVGHLVIVSPCLGLQLNFWVKKWLFLLYIH